MSLRESIDQSIFPDRIVLRDHLERERKGQTMVFTNGCFDLLHRGHVDYLSRARDLGDYLVLGLNRDESVRKLKGEGRPINREMDRAFVLAALACVDYVTLFGEETPIETLSILKPRYHVKGGDYRLEDLPERATVESGGGEIVLIHFVDGYSTTSILKRSQTLT